MVLDCHALTLRQRVQPGLSGAVRNCTHLTKNHCNVVGYMRAQNAQWGRVRASMEPLAPGTNVIALPSPA